MKIKTLAIALLMLCNQSYATELIQGNAPLSTGCPTPPVQTFTVGVMSMTFDIANGIVYVGLQDGGDTYAVSSFQRSFDSNQVLHFTPRALLATDGVQGGSVPFLAMATAPGDTCSRVAGVSGNTPNRVFILDITNNVHFSMSGITGDTDNLLKLYTSTLNQPGADAGAINGLAANRCFIFAAVSDGTWGDENSGIAVVSIDQCSLELYQTAAVPGDKGIKAAELDSNSLQLKIGGSSTISFDSDNMPQLVWDDQLDRLYVGVTLSVTGTDEATDGGRSIVVGTVGNCPQKGTLEFAPSIDGSVFNMGETDGIIGVIPGGFAETNQNALVVNNLGVMHCSTGPSYLIVDGGVDLSTTTTAGSNTIYALPLVDKCNPCDTMQGLLASKDSFDTTTHTFTLPVLTNAELTLSTDLAAQVGNGPIPIQPNQNISYMQVLGDTVYISLQIPQDDENETGVLYSQAQFDNEGKIQSWTPWTKRVWPICGFPNSPSNGQVSFFNVDAVTGKVLAVDGTPQQTVRITRWSYDDDCTLCEKNCSLAAAINRSLCSGCYSVLDLDQSTQGIDTDIAYRYALFGGTGKVDFALISKSRAAATPFDVNPETDIPYPQRVTVDYCCPDFFMETELDGCVNVLEYARRTTAQGNTNYFFAGTDDGLFVFANPDGTGFNVTDFGLMCQKPFCSGVWYKITTISGSITDIKTTGNTLYVMTFATSCDEPFHSEIKRIDFTDNITTMFDTTNIYTIAATGSTTPSTPLTQTILFTQMEIIQTSEDDTQEQLVVTTNNGIFQSNKTGGVQNATTPVEANWTLLLNNTLFYGIGAVDNAKVLSTIWPFSAQDACGFKTYERSSIHQLNGENVVIPTAIPTFDFVPDFFNHMITCGSCACKTPCDQTTMCCPETTQTPCELMTTACATSCEPECCVTPQLVNSPCSDLKLFEKINYFWSDGGRRFFIITPTNSKLACFPCCGRTGCCCPKQNLRFLEVTPFDTCAWKVSDPIHTVLQDTILTKQSAFYWVRPIGMTGVILSGTQSGVVALE